MRRYVLGLETGIDGGSISVLENEKIIDSISGAGNISRSEDLLSMLENILIKNNIDKREIKLILISDEPGSLTGIRIGLATVKGLGDALFVPVRRIPILEAMCLTAGRIGNTLTAIITQKGKVYFKEYYIDELKKLSSLIDEVKMTNIEEFVARIKNKYLNGGWQFVFCEQLSAESSMTRELELMQDVRLNIIKGSFAEILGRLAYTDELSRLDV